MKKKWWIVLIIVVMLIGLGIVWFLIPECEKEYRDCLIMQKMGYDNICSSCEELERIRQPENKSDCEERYESCLIDKEAGANILCEPCD